MVLQLTLGGQLLTLSKPAMIFKAYAAPMMPPASSGQSGWVHGSAAAYHAFKQTEIELFGYTAAYQNLSI